MSTREATCQELQFSSGIYPVHEPELPENWNSYVKQWVADHDLEGNTAVLTHGPSSKHPDANYEMEIIDLKAKQAIDGRGAA